MIIMKTSAAFGSGKRAGLSLARRGLERLLAATAAMPEMVFTGRLPCEAQISHTAPDAA